MVSLGNSSVGTRSPGLQLQGTLLGLELGGAKMVSLGNSIVETRPPGLPRLQLQPS